MNYADIIWKLVEKILEEKQEEKKTNDPNSERRD